MGNGCGLVCEHFQQCPMYLILSLGRAFITGLKDKPQHLFSLSTSAWPIAHSREKKHTRFCPGGLPGRWRPWLPTTRTRKSSARPRALATAAPVCARALRTTRASPARGPFALTTARGTVSASPKSNSPPMLPRSELSCFFRFFEVCLCGCVCVFCLFVCRCPLVSFFSLPVQWYCSIWIFLLRVSTVEKTAEHANSPPRGLQSCLLRIAKLSQVLPVQSQQEEQRRRTKHVILLQVAEVQENNERFVASHPLGPVFVWFVFPGSSPSPLSNRVTISEPPHACQPSTTTASAKARPWGMNSRPRSLFFVELCLSVPAKNRPICCLQKKRNSPRYETPWDAEKQVGCKCDAGFRGPDCSLQECPSGPDVMGGDGSTKGRDCSGRGEYLGVE